uniref:Large ribosomal subunit protein bL33c n=2 Tax=Grateloupia TaxID=31454 RepID=A0A6F8UNK9_9FLOR|nr:50S ribosomal protein L33 [Grateloupia filicina]AWD77439.1 50S ribosomal protein L33 [Grateloupia filicina]BCB15064.1 50S ribosomal protein L33 [Grateloupia asiatica]
MAKSKEKRIIITLECECRNLQNVQKRKAGIFRYTTSKNKRNTPSRLELKKFCPNCNCHRQFKEIK